jgi:uncharacterized protein YunC (DUF1805 family)
MERIEGPIHLIQRHDPLSDKTFYYQGRETMLHEKIQLSDKEADSYVIPLGGINLVAVTTDTGLVGCGVFDVFILDKFSYPAARVRSVKGGAINNVDDLLNGIVKDANDAAQKRGVKVGMTGKLALECL